MPFYYPNWINDFWRIMGLIHFGDKDHFCVPGEKRFDETAIRAFCTSEGLAFYDTACEVRRLRDNASDAFLEVVTPTDVPALLRQIPLCNTLVTTGQKATEVIATEFGCEVPPVGGSTAIFLPCPDRTSHPETLPETLSETLSDTRLETPDQTPLPETPTPRPIRFWRMPSTSRAYPLPLDKKTEIYRRLFLSE